MKLGFSAGWPGSHPGFWTWRSFVLSQSSGWDNISPSTSHGLGGQSSFLPGVTSGALPSQNGRSRYSQTHTDAKSKQSSGFYRPAVCVQLNEFSGWLLHSFEMASLGEWAAFTYKYPFSCKESAFSWISWKEPSNQLIPTFTWKGLPNTH